MAPSKLRQALGAVKDQTSIGLAKVGSGGTVEADLDVAIVRATSHSESFPADERHIREILALTCLSRVYVGNCVSTLSRRLGRTRSWAVALKTLVIVHRVLADGDPAFEQEVFYATRRGTRMLNMFDFCDRSRADAWDFSAFVRTYAAYLDDRLEYRMQGRHGGGAPRGPSGRQDDAADAEGADRALALVTRDPPASEMTVDQLLIKANQLHHLLDRFIACRPIGAARTNRVVAVSLYPLVKESVQLYCELTEVMAALIEQFAEMETADCERVHALFCSLAKQTEELEAFYSWCKEACVCRQSDVPEVEVVTQKKLGLMDEFIRDRHAAASQHGLPPPSPEPAASPEPVLVEEQSIKALPAPEEQPTEAQEEDTAQAEPEALLIVADPVDEEADFLNLKADAMPAEEHGQQLVLALFDGNPAGAAPKGDAFDHSAADWETALVQSASALASQRAELGGGLSMLVLDGMYSHATANAAVASAQTFSGSASSVALRPPGAPMLALPAPPGAIGADPFAASALLPPPTYVQMSDMHTKQQLLTQEQIVWQQYGKNGMQGQGPLAMLEQRPQQQLQQQILPNGDCN
ncbi:putative clathrin assembly protein At4g02650 [Panicum hallii]|uniref:putative clathrin assembly protein At4g02650 n=1 Tax=Panicum hallii TaxID=206008 RepID=UPI000DF4EE89|nr:putative clathrin assembly protein At4g02650 [Panicum hallii]